MISPSDAIRALIEAATTSDRLVATTGYTARELHAILGDDDRAFYMIGSMGLALPLGAGIAARPAEHRVIVLDGDGALLMGLAGLVMAADLRPINLHHVVLHNGCYASTGGQRLPGERVDFETLARGAGYAACGEARTAAAIALEAGRLWQANGPTLLVAEVEATSSPPSRVTAPPHRIQRRFRQRYLDTSV